MESVTDFQQKYGSTFVRKKLQDGTLHVISVDHVDTGSEVVSWSTMADGSQSNYNKAFWDSLDLTPPDVGLFNHSGYALHLFRAPTRQWRRGFCGANHSLVNPITRLLQDGIYRPSFGLRTANSAFNPKYVAWENVIEHFANYKNSPSVAVTSKIAISRSPLANKSYVLWFGMTPVGWVRPDYSAEVKDPLFVQEVIDEFRIHGLTRWIS